jgi:hypothetical protein
VAFAEPPVAKPLLERALVEPAGFDFGQRLLIEMQAVAVLVAADAAARAPRGVEAARDLLLEEALDLDGRFSGPSSAGKRNFGNGPDAAQLDEIDDWTPRSPPDGG